MKEIHFYIISQAFPRKIFTSFGNKEIFVFFAKTMLFSLYDLLTLGRPPKAKVNTTGDNRFIRLDPDCNGIFSSCLTSFVYLYIRHTEEYSLLISTSLVCF